LERSLIKTLRKDLARHNQTNLSIKTEKKQDQNELKTIYLKYGIQITQKKWKPKLEHEEQRKKKKGNKLSGTKPRKCALKEMKST